MASITMSASSSEVEIVGLGAGGGVGSALAVPIEEADSPIAAPATADNSHRIGTPFPLLHSLIPPRKLTPDRIRRMPNTTNV
jgi:hypothetical protein